MRKIAAFVLSIVLVYGFASQEGGAGVMQVGEQAPALALPALDGRKISLSDFSGKVVLVDFWATWCPPCRAEMPDLVKLNQDLAPRGFTILGVAMDEDGAEAVTVVLNGAAGAPAGWSVPGLPTAYLIGRDGRLLRRWLGGKNPDELRAAVEAALAAPSSPSRILSGGTASKKQRT